VAIALSVAVERLPIAWLPFEGLPKGWAAFFTLALVVIAALLAWTAVLFWRARLARRNAPIASAETTDGFVWVFLVPALNEEVTIRDSVRRLLEMHVPQPVIVVIDDGSTDGTPDVLRDLAHPRLHVLRRDPPDARQGKAAALNHAYRELGRILGEGTPRDRVIVAVVDADGRLDPRAAEYAAAHFADPVVGGVQSLVRIYNRSTLLTWMQDLEFSVYGCLFQAGRNASGTAGMGGNGQFNRLHSLDDVADGGGPWRDRLTEDQDLGLRLIAAGWHGRQELRGVVEQQGLPNLRALFRQRTRWSQGNLQAMRLVGTIWRSRLRVADRLDLTAYLLMPFFQGLIGTALIAAVVLAATGEASFWGAGPVWMLVFVYLLGFGGTILGCIAARADRGRAGPLIGFATGQIYAFYSWLLWPVLVRSSLRQLTEHRDWAKTEREPLGTQPPAD
jgi:1,2-diacylglycerol 3-beta-glucosyltransferase